MHLGLLGHPSGAPQTFGTPVTTFRDQYWSSKKGKKVLSLILCDLKLTFLLESPKAFSRTPPWNLWQDLYFATETSENRETTKIFGRQRARRTNLKYVAKATIMRARQTSTEESRQSKKQLCYYSSLSKLQRKNLPVKCFSQRKQKSERSSGCKRCCFYPDFFKCSLKYELGSISLTRGFT